MQKKAIYFYYHHINFYFPNRIKTAAWLSFVAKTHQYSVDKYTVVFCKENYLLALNKFFLKHNTHTDILTFDLAGKQQQKRKSIFAECYISVPRIKENSSMYSTPFQMELRRVLAHGILHICGFKDDTAINKGKMRQAESQALKAYKNFI